MPLVLNGTTGVSGVDGSAGTPALRGTDADSGVYFTGSQVGFSTNGAGTTMTMDASGNVTFPGTVVMSSPYAMRNRIINGAMQIDQRYSGSSVNPTDVVYVLDRWFGWASQLTKYSIQQNAGAVTPPVGFSNYLGVTSLSSYSVLNSDYFGVAQPIEGLNIQDFAFGTSGAKSITLSFWVRSSLTGTFGGTIQNSAQTRSYIFSYAILAANTWEYKTITIPGDTTGTWLTNNGTGMRLGFSIGAGSTYLNTAGTWASGNYISATGATSVVGTNGATFYITGVQLEVGTVATPFERRLYPQELTMCQRYYEGVRTLFQTCSNAGLANSYINTITYKVQKRANPSVVIYSSVDFQGSANVFTFYPGAVAGGCNIESQSVDGIALSRPGVSTYNLMTGSMTASAELS